MTIDRESQITPADYPELAQLIWNGNPARPISAADAFSLYERNWRFVDRNTLSAKEADFIAALAELFGNGVLLVS